MYGYAYHRTIFCQTNIAFPRINRIMRNMMCNLIFPWEMPANAVVQIIGPHPLILNAEYDDRQLWLPFINAVVMYTVPVKAKSQKIDLKKRATRVFALIPDIDRVLVVPERHVPQLPLPFEGWRFVTKTYWRRLTEAGLPGWQTKSNGKSLTFAHQSSRQDELREFCDNNCRGRYYSKQGRIYFELINDYAVARIAFGTAD